MLIGFIFVGNLELRQQYLAMFNDEIVIVYVLFAIYFLLKN